MHKNHQLVCKKHEEKKTCTYGQATQDTLFGPILVDIGHPNLHIISKHK